MSDVEPGRIARKFKKALSTLWRAGLYHDISLTAIVVCGDQSSGKSSVLEAMSGFRFPVNDGMCTRFVTRVEMEQDETVRLEATITPSGHHGQQKQKGLSEWRYETGDLSEFGDVVLRAGEAMGIETEKGFLKDQLVIRVSAPELPVFVYVDVPGIIRSTREGQPDSDIDYIENLVTTYMADPTKIVLTIVAATNDLELQGVLRHAKQIDPEGLRTIGVITKPDACHDRPSIQQAALKLLENKGNGLYQWFLGWHVVKNRSDSQRGMTTAQRDEAEALYLAQPPWDQVPDEFKGAENLSTRLEARVFDAFISSLPKLRIQIQDKIQEATVDLDWLTSNTSNVSTMRTELGDYLDRIVAEMLNRVSNAGQDTKDIFGAGLEDIAADLVNIVRSRGHYYEFDDSCLVEQPRLPTAMVQTEWDAPVPRPLCELHNFADSIVAEAEVGAGQLSDTMCRDLFRKQISKWPRILQQYIDGVRDLFDAQLSEVCSHIVPEEMLDAFNDVVMSTQVDLFASQLRGHVQKLLVPGKLRGTKATEATLRAWKVQHDITEEERLKKAFGITDNQKTSIVVKNPKREYDIVLQRLKELDVDVGRFTARQATALMQILYIDRTDELKPWWDEKAVLRSMKDFLVDLTARVLSNVSDNQLKAMNAATIVENDSVADLKGKLELYNESLAVLADL